MWWVGEAWTGKVMFPGVLVEYSAKLQPLGSETNGGGRKLSGDVYCTGDSGCE